MKKLFMLTFGVLAAGAVFAAPAHITITPPEITQWEQDVGVFGTYTMSPSEIDDINAALGTAFGQIESDLNTTYFDNIEGFSQLAKGFANANMAAFDNASLLGYQTYDLFAGSVGFNLSAAAPSLDPQTAIQAFEDIVTTGDVYAGVGTGGFAGQFGLNLGLLVKNLYGSVKVGYIPQTDFSGVAYSQGMFGIGANYTLLPQIDILFGFVKWRGLSLGSGIVFNSSEVEVSVPVQSQTTTQNLTTTKGDIQINAKTTNTTMTLNVKQSSTVIPIDLMTSLQALWFVNLGLGVGADLALSSASIGVTGASDFAISSDDPNATIVSNPGRVKLASPTGESAGDFFVPRLAASLGLNLAILKIDIPVSYYPTTKAFAFGVTGAIVW